jgi:hypothetical protein
VRRAKPAARRGFRTWNRKVVQGCRLLDNEDIFGGVLLPPLVRSPDVNPGGCGSMQRPPGWLAWGHPAQHRGCRSLGVPGSWVQGPRVPPMGYRNGGRWGRCERLTDYGGSWGRSGSGIVGVGRGWWVDVVPLRPPAPGPGPRWGAPGALPHTRGYP